ncbi:MAG: hypothetical protein WBA51_18705 [Erythrobacter sp.]
MAHRLFEPWVGENYEKVGLRDGQKLLLVGDSHYASDISDGRNTDLTNKVVHQMIDDGEWAFFKHVRMVANGLEEPIEMKSFWHQVAFVNLLQETLPESSSIPSKKQIANGWLALRETVEELKPDVMFIFSARAWDQSGVEADRIEEEASPFQPLKDLYGIGAFPRIHATQLVAARFNHPRQPGCERSVWRAWAELAWQTATSKQR